MEDPTITLRMSKSKSLDFNPKPRSDMPASSMTIREAFAMAALQGLLATPGKTDDAVTTSIRAVRRADALLKELGKD